MDSKSINSGHSQGSKVLAHIMLRSDVGLQGPLNGNRKWGKPKRPCNCPGSCPTERSSPQIRCGELQRRS
eukprot:130777-Amphidinium_carterae.1